MSVVVLASAKGSPGTTLTGLGLSWAWPGDVVLVDADPADVRVGLPVQVAFAPTAGGDVPVFRPRGVRA